MSEHKKDKLELARDTSKRLISGLDVELGDLLIRAYLEGYSTGVKQLRDEAHRIVKVEDVK